MTGFRDRIPGNEVEVSRSEIGAEGNNIDKKTENVKTERILEH